LKQPAELCITSVDTVLKMCGLEKFADAIVGSLGVEHRKRTTIGVELAAKVRVMIIPLHAI
jgi:ATP-binding cassette, subfamily G (WHITE), member 2, SNQ2